MGRYMKKCRVIGELAVMEVSQVVGVRTRAMTTALAAATRAAKSRKAVSSVAAEYQIAYLQLRNRSLVMTPLRRISRSGAKCSGSGSGSPRCSTPDRGEISRCESNASCDQEAAELRSDNQELDEESESVACYSSFRRDREMMPSSNSREQSYDFESTAERRSPCRSTAVITPSDVEIEDFFAAAEKKETQRFASTYNYDLMNDVPLKGRYEWVAVAP